MNVYKLEAAIGLNTTEYQKGLKSAGDSMAAMGDKIKAGAAAIGKATAAGLAAGSAAVTALAKSAVSAYADYEQYIGGIETLFGNSAETLIKNSEKAFATAGMDVNQYMETSIQSAASLINSLDGDQQKAAELMDISITDMADNVNKMGTSMEGVQNAYRGFSRGNFQMLDNLALGFSGTKEGMQELLDKAQEISGIQYDISSYSDIVQAIHVVQTEMGITGTTAKEAAKTISGSIGAAKAAWKNLTVEIAKDNGDVSEAFKLFGNSVGNVFENILPRAEQALDGVGDLIVEAAPQISKSIGQLVPKIVPSVLKTGVSIVGAVGKGLVQAAPELLTATSDIMKTVFNSFMGADLGVFDWIKDDASRVVEAVKATFKNIDIKALKDSFGNIGTAVGNIFERVGDGAAWLTENVIGPFTEWVANSNVLDGIAAGFNLIGDAVDFLKTPAIAVWEGFLQPILSTAADVWDVAAGGLKKLANGLNGIDWEGYWIDMFDGHFGEDWKLGWQTIYDAFAQGGEAIDDFFNVSKYGQAWNEFWQGVGGIVFDVKDKIVGAVNEIENAMARIFGDPEKEAAEEWNVGDTITDDKGREFLMYNADGTRTAAYNAYIRQQAEKQYEAWKSFNIEEYRKANGIPAYAEGGRVTQPTLALIGEKEPETVVPDSKRSEFGNTTNIEKVEIVVNGAEKNGSEIAEEISRVLSELSIRQKRAVGGTGW